MQDSQEALQIESQEWNKKEIFHKNPKHADQLEQIVVLFWFAYEVALIQFVDEEVQKNISPVITFLLKQARLLHECYYLV